MSRQAWNTKCTCCGSQRQPLYIVRRLKPVQQLCESCMAAREMTHDALREEGEAGGQFYRSAFQW